MTNMISMLAVFLTGLSEIIASVLSFLEKDKYLVLAGIGLFILERGHMKRIEKVERALSVSSQSQITAVVLCELKFIGSLLTFLVIGVALLIQHVDALKPAILP